MLVRLVRSLGFWVAIAVVGVITLGVVLSFTYWDWLQGGTDRSGNGDTVRSVALVVGGIVAILLALWRSVVAERQATAPQPRTGKPQPRTGSQKSRNGLT